MLISEKASIFNQYFNSVFTTENSESLSSLHKPIHFHPKLIDTIYVAIMFTPGNIYDELVTLQCNKACGPDSIPVQLLKVGAELISSPLSRIFQLSGSLDNC